MAGSEGTATLCKALRITGVNKRLQVRSNRGPVVRTDIRCELFTTRLSRKRRKVGDSQMPHLGVGLEACGLGLDCDLNPRLAADPPVRALDPT